MRLEQYHTNERIAKMVNSGREVLINLTQNVEFSGHAGHFAPCLLTKSVIWSTQQGRLLLAQELLAAQGVPVFGPQVQASGLPVAPVCADVGQHALTRMAGNAFHVACAGSFVGFVLCNLQPVGPIEDDGLGAPEDCSD